MQHWGVDLSAIGTAISDAYNRRALRGASTITMQTVKNLFFLPGAGVIRKPLEWALTPLAGFVWGKSRTLELYLNAVEWGEQTFGIEAAAQRYFRTSARQLSLQQAAALVAILPNPRYFSPLRMSHSTRRRYERIVREAALAEVPRGCAENTARLVVTGER